MERPWQDEDTLHELYHEQGLTTTEIGERLGCGEGTVWRWMEKHDIPRRNKGPKRTHTKLSDRDWLKREYVDKRKTAYQIADELSCVDGTVYYWMRKHGIEARKEHNGQELADPRLADEEWLKEQHYEKRRSYEEIANECGVTNGAVQYWMAQHELEYQPRKEWYYGPNWLEQREKALERDDYGCVVCGMSNSEHKQIHGRALACHHITPLRKFRGGGELDYESANNVENLVMLCYGCHGTWEGVPVRPTR